MTQDLIERLRCDETPPGSTRSRLRSRCFPKTAADERRVHGTGEYTSSQHGVAKYVRAATARGTRRRGYFAAAVAARSRSRQAIMAAFLRIPLRGLRIGPRFALCLPLSLFSFAVSVSRRRFLSLRASFLYRGPFSCSRLCRFLSVLSRLLYPLLRNQTRGPRWYAAQWRSRRRVVPH